MISNKKIVQQLAAVLTARGIGDIVISPGSRNAPLINTLTALPQFRCLNIVDERSAGFFALGMAVQLQKPVVLVCTSGSAVLNYAPAVSEAFYQKVPLLIVTADRPPEWIGQNDGQTIRQPGIYGNYIRSSHSLPEKIAGPDDEWHAARVVNQAVNELSWPEPGPVHINIPLAEPLYELTEAPLPAVKIIHLHREAGIPPASAVRELAALWNESKNKLIIAGQMPPSSGLDEILNSLAADPAVAVLAEPTANLRGGNLISRIDNVCTAIAAEAAFAPDLLLTLGGQVVSRKIKLLLRKYKPRAHCHFSRAGEHIDTYQSLTGVIAYDPVAFLAQLREAVRPGASDYGTRWRELDLLTRRRRDEFLRTCGFTDLTAFGLIVRHLPERSLVHLANSTPVRYAQLFDYDRDIAFLANRGVSGIDGVVSTAAGTAYATDKITTVIAGDLAFFYDSNALWNSNLPANLRIIVLNNSGGGIFRFLDGPAAMPELETHFAARHNRRAADVARACGLACRTAGDEAELAAGLQWLYDSGRTGPAFLEVLTPPEESAAALKSYFNYLK